MYIKEDITIDVLKNNGYTVSSDLSTFVQDYLNTKYDYILQKRDSMNVNIVDTKKFALLMYMFNSLINVECMEFDNTCYTIIYGKDKSHTVNIPQDNGYDVVVDYLPMSPIFHKSPSFMINGIVHPDTYDTKTVYLELLYRLILSGVEFNYDILMPFGESVKNMFLEAKKQNIKSDRVISKLILSQFPSFTDYIESIKSYLKEILQVEFKPSRIKNKKIETDISFKSVVFESMKEGIKVNENDLNEKYDKKLSDKYYNYFTKSMQVIEPLIKNNLYAYPKINDSLIYPYNEQLNRQTLDTTHRVIFNGEIYFQVLNRVMPDSFKDIKEWSTSMLEIGYKVKRAYYSLLKAYYFSYHMRFNKFYGELYLNNSSVGVILKNDFVYKKINEEIYYPVWTLNQCNSIKNKETLINLILKTVWHNNKFIVKKVEAPIRKLLSEKKDDMHIFNALTTLYKQNKPRDTGFDKGEFRYNELLKTRVFDNVLSYRDKKNIKYLDFGGGIGDVGASIAKNLGFLKENSFVTDIQNWLGKEHTEEYAKYITYRYLKSNDLPFENESIDFITCLQVLHHIPDKNYTLFQLYRILKPGGYILIREHNCESIQDQMLIDLEHSLHAFVVDEQGQDYLQNYNDTYMSKLDLETLVRSYGFIKDDSIVFEKEKGITKYYYSLWVKGTIRNIQQKDDGVKKIKSVFYVDEKQTDLQKDLYRQSISTSMHSGELQWAFKYLNVDEITSILKSRMDFDFPYVKLYSKPKHFRLTQALIDNFGYPYTKYNEKPDRELIDAVNKKYPDVYFDDKISLQKQIDTAIILKKPFLGMLYINPVKYYFKNLKSFKADYSTDINNIFKNYASFKTIKNVNNLYYFKESDKIPSLKKNSVVTILTNKDDFKNIDIITNFFTEEARMKAKVCKGKTEGCMSPIEYWNKNLSNVITYLYTEKQDLNIYTLREAMFALCPEATLFKTTVAKTIYDIFKPKVILDMSSGWGDRLIASIAYSQTVNYDVKYFGYDPNSSLTQGYKDIIESLADDNKQNFMVKTEPFETADLSYIKEDIDLVFTSPPYFDFEVYSDDSTQSIVQYPTFTNWCVNFLFRSLKLAFSKLRKDGYLVMHITDTKNMPNVCELIMLFIEGYIGGKFIGTINTQAPGKKAIPMWVYKKGNNINDIYKKNMSSFYPEINTEINKSLLFDTQPQNVKLFEKSWADYSDDED